MKTQSSKKFLAKLRWDFCLERVTEYFFFLLVVKVASTLEEHEGIKKKKKKNTNQTCFLQWVFLK